MHCVDSDSCCGLLIERDYHGSTGASGDTGSTGLQGAIGDTGLFQCQISALSKFICMSVVHITVHSHGMR